MQPSRQDTKAITVHFPEEVRRQLKAMAGEQGRYIDDMVAEAFNLLFAKYRKAEIAPRKSRQVEFSKVDKPTSLLGAFGRGDEGIAQARYLAAAHPFAPDRQPARPIQPSRHDTETMTSTSRKRSAALPDSRCAKETSRIL